MTPKKGKIRFSTAAAGTVPPPEPKLQGRAHAATDTLTGTPTCHTRADIHTGPHVIHAPRRDHVQSPPPPAAGGARQRHRVPVPPVMPEDDRRAPRGPDWLASGPAPSDRDRTVG